MATAPATERNPARSKAAGNNKRKIGPQLAQTGVCRGTTQFWARRVPGSAAASRGSRGKEAARQARHSEKLRGRQQMERRKGARQQDQ